MRTLHITIDFGSKVSFYQEMKDVQFSIHISYLEVYQEELHDLLHITTPAQDIHIRENESGNTSQSTHLVY